MSALMFLWNDLTSRLKSLQRFLFSPEASPSDQLEEAEQTKYSLESLIERNNILYGKRVDAYSLLPAETKRILFLGWLKESDEKDDFEDLPISYLEKLYPELVTNGGYLPVVQKLLNDLEQAIRVTVETENIDAINHFMNFGSIWNGDVLMDQSISRMNAAAVISEHPFLSWGLHTLSHGEGSFSKTETFRNLCLLIERNHGVTFLISPINQLGEQLERALTACYMQGLVGERVTIIGKTFCYSSADHSFLLQPWLLLRERLVAAKVILAE